MLVGPVYYRARSWALPWPLTRASALPNAVLQPPQSPAAAAAVATTVRVAAGGVTPALARLGAGDQHGRRGVDRMDREGWLTAWIGVSGRGQGTGA